MRIVKAIGKFFFCIALLVLLTSPVYLIYRLSREEMQDYVVPEAPVIGEYAYGDLCQAFRGTLEEFVTVSGTYVCRDLTYMELDYKDCSLIRWEVDIGDTVLEGQCLGYYKSEPVVSTVTGRIRNIQAYGTDCYIQLQLFSPTVLECHVSEQLLNTLLRSTGLTTQTGEQVEVLSCAPIPNPDGTTTIQLSVTGTEGGYGTTQELQLYTGRSYTGVLLLDEDCVYRKSTEEDRWYVRRVTQDGVFINEAEVRIGYSDGSKICVSGNIQEGDFFDSGYKYVLAGGGE